ncbi:putative late blight resistance protein homolog R1C-3 [Primulina huaijiensis]|uniref:putative late blight resistance protein homolog R1C-3 n=1 Tax=Primulina huaijiensis TaxID=1492673 RepID=UPI003CC6FB88
MDQLAEDLYKSLKGRQYLIVMDDVWDTEFWDDIRRVFPDDNNGSRIILTTRLSEVAIHANSFSSIHHMSPLTLEESWNLLRATVFGEESCPSKFEKIGKDIAKNCKGLPLAVAVIGGLLSKGRRTQDYLEYIARNVKSLVIGNDDRLMGILSLSYSYLPDHLKSCFLYMGVFPEDQEISVSQLVMLWLAEGFLKHVSSKNLEEVAEEYLNDLVNRNLVVACQRNHHGLIKTCSIHDLLRDLCVKKAEEESFLLVIGRHVRLLSEGRKSSHRISIHKSHLGSSFISGNINSIRSLLYFEPNYSGDRKLYFLGRLKLLIVLDALSMVFREIPSEIFLLVNLRYLAFIYKRAGACFL